MPGRPGHPAQRAPESFDAANAVISNARKAFEACGMAVKSSVVEGSSVYQAILEAAETLDADLVVMGAHGRRGLEKLILGSVTVQMLSLAHWAVLVVRDQAVRAVFPTRRAC